MDRSSQSPRNLQSQAQQQSSQDRQQQQQRQRQLRLLSRATTTAAAAGGVKRDARLEDPAAAASSAVSGRRSGGGGGGTTSAASRRSMELAQSVRQRRSLLSQMSSAQSSTASSVVGALPLGSLAPKIDNRPALIIEIGTRLTRIGFAGEFVPREILRTEWFDPLDGPYPQQAVPVFDRTRTAQAQYEVLVKFLKNIVFRKLLTTVNSRRVVLVESLLTPNWQRNAIARALFECPSLSVHSILFAPSHLLCSFPFNARNCLVVDLGADEAVLFPIAEGVLMLNSWETSSAPCATALERSVRRLMVRYGRVRSGDDDPEGRPLNEQELARADEAQLWEDVAIRFCFATTAARGKRIQAHLSDPEEHPFEGAAPPAELQFGASQLLRVPGLVREGAAEALFAASDEQDARSITQLVLDCVAKASIDMRRDFLKNLLLVGGVTRLPGFLARLKTELLSSIADGYHPKLVPQLHDIRFYQFPAEVRGQLFCAWLGGSMFGTFDDNLAHRSLTRREWLATKRVPDWTSQIDAHFAKFGTEQNAPKTDQSNGGLAANGIAASKSKNDAAAAD